MQFKASHILFCTSYHYHYIKEAKVVDKNSVSLRTSGVATSLANSDALCHLTSSNNGAECSPKPYKTSEGNREDI